MTSAYEKEYENLKAWLAQTGDQPLEAMDAFFAARLAEYEEHMSPWARHYGWMAELLPEGTASLLDIGCGTGLELEAIFRRFPDLAVTGVDLSAAMLAKLAEKYKNHPALRLVRGDYFQCDLGENRFDAAVSFQTLHHFTAEKKAALFAKLCRALKPGGVYLECDYIAQSQAIEDLVFSECARRRERDGIPQDWFVHFDTPLTLDHELAALRSGGFSRVEVLGFLPGDANTPMIRAVKSPLLTPESTL